MFIDDNDVDESFFEVRAKTDQPYLTDEDRMQRACARLARALRSRPTMPADPCDADKSWTDVASGAKLPLYCCAFRGCTWTGVSRDELVEHLKTEITIG